MPRNSRSWPSNWQSCREATGPGAGRLAELQALAGALQGGEGDRPASTRCTSACTSSPAPAVPSACAALGAAARVLEQRTRVPGWRGAGRGRRRGVPGASWNWASSRSGRAGGRASVSHASGRSSRPPCRWALCSRRDDPGLGDGGRRRARPATRPPARVLQLPGRLFARIDEAERAAQDESPDMLIMDVMFEAEGRNSTAALADFPALRAWAVRCCSSPRPTISSRARARRPTGRRRLLPQADRHSAPGQPHGAALRAARRTAATGADRQRRRRPRRPPVPGAALRRAWWPRLPAPARGHHGGARRLSAGSGADGHAHAALHRAGAGGRASASTTNGPACPSCTCRPRPTFERQIAAMRRGGDDFIIKPVSDVQLVAAVRVRVERARQLADRGAEQGQLTGLLKHASIKEVAAKEIRRAPHRQAGDAGDARHRPLQGGE